MHAGSARSQAPAFERDQRLADPGFEAPDEAGPAAPLPEHPAVAAPPSTFVAGPGAPSLRREFSPEDDEETVRRKLAPMAMPAPVPAPTAMPLARPAAPPAAVGQPNAGGPTTRPAPLRPPAQPQGSAASSLFVPAFRAPASPPTPTSALAAGLEGGPRPASSAARSGSELSSAFGETAAKAESPVPALSPRSQGPRHDAALLSPREPVAPPLINADASAGAPTSTSSAATPVVEIGRLEIEVVPAPATPAAQASRAATPAGPRTAASVSQIGPLRNRVANHRFGRRG